MTVKLTYTFMLFQSPGASDGDLVLAVAAFKEAIENAVRFYTLLEDNQSAELGVQDLEQEPRRLPGEPVED